MARSRPCLVDITELKKRMTQYGEKDEFRFVFETECEDEENDRRFCIWSRGYTPSLNEKAALRKDLKKLMGRELTKAELDEFDLEGPDRSRGQTHHPTRAQGR
jgi:hypothetical protein